MTDKEFDEFLAWGLNLYAEKIIKEIESDPNYKNMKMSDESREKLMKRINELEKGGC